MSEIINSKVPIELLEKYRDYYNQQEGRKYPCSNQIVCCGIFTDDRNKAIKFMEDKDVIQKQERKDSITWYLNNGEKWVWKHWNKNCRGHRFYKIAVDQNIDAETLNYLILPYCSLYCCSFEIL